MPEPSQHLDFIMDFEGGQIESADRIVEGVQAMIDDGTIYHLQGSWQRLAAQLVADGQCHLPGQCVGRGQ